MPDVVMTPGNRDPWRYRKTTLSVAMVALIAAGAPAYQLFDQFSYEKEGSRTTAYLDGASIWTICKGLTRYKDEPVRQGLSLSAAECREADAQAAKRALAEAQDIIKPEVWATLSEPAKAAIADMIHNLGKGKAAASSAVRLLNAGKRNEGCAAITLWIFDAGRDCRKAGSNCQGQPTRRMQEDELCLTGDAQ